MISKKLKRLSRRELVDIIYQLKTNEQNMQEEIISLKQELEDKRIKLSEAGSIANAAISVTNIFSVAQTTADFYLNEIACMKEETKRECKRKLEEADKKAEETIAAGEKKLAELEKLCKKEQEKLQNIQCRKKKSKKSKKR